MPEQDVKKRKTKVCSIYEVQPCRINAQFAEFVTQIFKESQTDGMHITLSSADETTKAIRPYHTLA